MPGGERGRAPWHRAAEEPASSPVPAPPSSFAAQAELEVRAGRDARAGGDLSGALRHYLRAQQLDPSSFAAAIGVADVEWDLGRQQQAATHYRSIASTFPVRMLPVRARERAQVSRPTAP